MRHSLIVLLMLPAIPLLGGPQSRSAPPAASREEDGGLWPTRKMMDLMIARWADMVTEHYDLDDQQSADLGAKMKARWTRFADDNEKTLKPLVSDFIELRLQMEPPTREQVQAWSQRAGQAFDLFEKEISQGAEEMRGLLRDDQRAKFDGEMMGFQAGMQLARTQLGRWQQGEFQEREFWDPPLAVRRARREAEKAKAAEAQAKEAKGAAEAAESAAAQVEAADADAPPDQIAAETDTWTKHVEDFIARYELDDAQKKSAYSILKELKERALAHRDANKPEIDKLERRIAQPGNTDAELEQIKEQLVKLYGPIDAMFEELQRRLEPIPTAKQKAAAGKRDKAREAAKKGEDGDKPAPRDKERDGG